MWKRIKEFFSTILDRFKDLIETISESKVGKTVKKIVSSTQSSIGMKAWFITDFLMDLFLYATTWTVLSGGLKFWVLVCLTIHMFQITREFVIAPLFPVKEVESSKVTHFHGIPTQVFDHE